MQPTNPTVSYDEAGTLALHDAMADDPTVALIGEGVSRGGPFGINTMLVEEFGSERVIETPAAHAISRGIGAALAGWNPVVDIKARDLVQFGLAELAQFSADPGHWRDGRIYLPFAVRVRIGFEDEIGDPFAFGLAGWLMGIPGLRIAVPTIPSDAYRLLRSAIRHTYPAVVIEDAALAAITGPIWPTDHAAAGGVKTLRLGRDASVLATSRLVHEALAAADDLAGQGVEVEVLDPRWLVPMDLDGVLASVRRTHRVVIAHEGMSAASELVASIQEHALADLAAPVLRVGHWSDEDPQPMVRPGRSAIVEALARVLG